MSNRDYTLINFHLINKLSFFLIMKIIPENVRFQVPGRYQV